MIWQRIKQFRLARNLSLDALADLMEGLVTKQALSKYENGQIKPSQSVMNKLARALGIKAMRLCIAPSIKVDFVAYRKGSGLPKKEQAKVESLVTQSLEERVRLQELVQEKNEPEFPIQSMVIKSLEDAEQAAVSLRQKWNIGLDPISNVTNTLENHFIHVIEIEADRKFDGISAVAIDERQQPVAAAVVSRRGVPGERQRLNLAHELGHLVLRVSATIDEEDAAFRFAKAFLVPSEVLYKEVGQRRDYVEMRELLLLKKKFGISLQALLFRLHELEIIKKSTYRQWCIDINRCGWRKKEPQELQPEDPQWLRQMIYRAVAEDLLGAEEATEMLGEVVGGKKVDIFIDRRAFMKLPVEERRQILVKQAEQLATYYGENTEWKELQGGDIIEY